MWFSALVRKLTSDNEALKRQMEALQPNRSSAGKSNKAKPAKNLQHTSDLLVQDLNDEVNLRTSKFHRNLAFYHAFSFL